MNVLNLLVLQKYVRRESFKDPLVPEALLWCEPLGRVPLEALRNEVHERVVRHVPQLHHYIL